MLTPLILIALCIGMGVLQWLKGWKVGSWLQVAVVAVWMVSPFFGVVITDMNRMASLHSPSGTTQRGRISPGERLLFLYGYPAIGAGLLFLLLACSPSRRGPTRRSLPGESLSPTAAADSVEFSALARKALLTAFPELAPHYREMEEGASFEIRFPHPAVPLELLIASRDREICISLDGTLRHGGSGEDFPAAARIGEAVAFLRSLFDGSLRLVRDLRWEGYSFCEEPEIWKDDPERNLVFTTWRALGRAA